MTLPAGCIDDGDRVVAGVGDDDDAAVGACAHTERTQPGRDCRRQIACKRVDDGEGGAGLIGDIEGLGPSVAHHGERKDADDGDQAASETS